MLLFYYASSYCLTHDHDTSAKESMTRTKGDCPILFLQESINHKRLCFQNEGQRKPEEQNYHAIIHFVDKVPVLISAYMYISLV